MKTIWELDRNTLRKNKKQKKVGEQKQNKKHIREQTKKKQSLFKSPKKNTY